MPTFRTVADNILHPLGLHLAKHPAESLPKDAFHNALTEIEGCFREVVFPEIPQRRRRVEMMSRLLGTTPSEAMYIIRSLACSMALPGDVCEFGVAQGATSALIANEIRDTDKLFWLFDSFEGLPRPTAEDTLINDIFNLGSMEAYAGTMANEAGLVKGRLQQADFPLDRVRIVPGFIEHTSKSPNLPAKVSFAYVDFDFYEPICIALDLLDSRLSPGGHIVVDDYGWFSSGAQKAVDRFVAAKNGAYEMTLPNQSAGHFAVLRKVPVSST
jgi:hypothetical protein